tara:strand:+ start:1211 stop:1534 length:324 start_codon:yes stop_codon:yes gene_type:complete
LIKKYDFRNTKKMKNILDTVLDSLKDLGSENGNVNLINANAKTKLFGENGNLDSMGLVIFISDLEELIDEEFGKNLTLADDRAMSQKTSPFRNVETLCKHIEILLSE